MKLSEMRDLLSARGIQLTKSLGQNFLHDANQLERIAALLFGATLIVCVAVVLGLAFAPGWVARLNNWFTLISAGFPALGTAVFGIRFQGDFGGSAQRSQNTADALADIGARAVQTTSPFADNTTAAAARWLKEAPETTN